MVQIYPFNGLRYNPQKVPAYGAVTAPPYDVISPSEQRQLHELNPYNIVRLILGIKDDQDNELQNVYSRAHQVLESWRTDGVMQTEESPAIYAYTQQWDNLERRGFIARLGLEPFETGKVLPHEYTLGGPKADRLALTKATGSILSPIFCLYNDPKKTIESILFESPSVQPIEVLDKDNVRHRFWPVTETEAILAIQMVLEDKAALIADGHHRYETALAYQAWRREQERLEDTPVGTLPCDFTMAFFTNMADPGLKVYPTHRVFTSFPTGWTWTKLVEAIAENFEPTTNQDALFWVQVSGQEKQPYRLKTGVNLTDIPVPLQSLDVALLDYFIFQGILKESASNLKQQGHLQFIRDEAEIDTLLNTEEVLVFWVHAPSVMHVQKICESGYRMPQKSTYFYPKLLSGLVLYYYGIEPMTSRIPEHIQ
jgi:uncharacterized protein (DUF1015 family)